MYGAIVPLQFSMVPTGSSTTLQMPQVPLLVFSGVGGIVTVLVLLAYAGFSAIVLVGLYRDLTAQPTP